MKRLGEDCVYLDITHQSPAFIEAHFPMVMQRCLQFGFDLRTDRVPVVPAAHYTCGGVKTDRFGQTDVPGLYAVGEVAFTGLHGANRMASNSLLECIVFAESACESIVAALPEVPPMANVRPWDASRVTNSDEEVVVMHNWHELRRVMWDYVGIVRSDQRLARAMRRIEMLSQEIQEYYGHFVVSKHLIELRHLVTVAKLIVQSACARKESRGLPHMVDNMCAVGGHD